MNAILENTKTELPHGFTARGAEMKDVEPALELFKAWSQSVIQKNDINDADAIRREWVSPNFDPAHDIRVVFSPEGKLVGYIEVWTTQKPPVHPWMWGRVHPDFSDLGIGSWLLQWAEERARQVLTDLPTDLRFAPRIGTYRPAEGSRKLFEDFGYKLIRSTYQMRIDMQAPPPAPLWAEGITLKTFTPEIGIEAVYRADDEAFCDHFGYIQAPFEEGLARFKHFMMGEDFDPSLWFLAMDGDEVAGICLGRAKAYDDPEAGYINILGVRRAWRKRGLGLALLHHSFGEFRRRGVHSVSLHVDAQSLTGALRLYEKAGMHAQTTSDMYEKTIRSGREISVESLT